MMRHFVLFDEATGEIKQRVSMAAPIEHALPSNLREITDAEALAQPEIYKRVDLGTMELVDK